MSPVRSLLALALSLVLGACGSKSPLLVPDRIDAGTDAGQSDAGPPPDRCIELPLNAPPEELQVEFLAQIQSADIYLLVDVTGSMEEEILRIRDTLTSEIIPGLVAEIPDVRLSVGRFADFDAPEWGYGSMGDEVYRLVQMSTDSSNVDRVLGAVSTLTLQSGGDTPEALTEALYLSATGQGHGRFVPPSSCPAGTVGYACFRERSLPIFVVFTDAPTHNGPRRSNPYMPRTVMPTPHTYEEAVAALNAIGAKVLGLNSGDMGETGRPDLEAYARDTGAVSTDGTPVVLDIGRTGELLSQSVNLAVRTLVTDVPIDVDVVLEDIEGDALDATMFVTGIVAERATPSDGATNLGDRWVNVRPGTRVEFRLVLQNLTEQQTDVAQHYLMRVVLRGDGVTRLTETVVDLVIPPIGGGRVCGP
ncbi:MAG: vWA domain-containing protein [Sandaracinaceae bacterium]